MEGDRSPRHDELQVSLLAASGRLGSPAMAVDILSVTSVLHSNDIHAMLTRQPWSLARRMYHSTDFELENVSLKIAL